MPHSILKNRLGVMETNLSFRTRYSYVKMSGRSLAQVLVRKDLLSEKCGHHKCFPCQTGGGVCTRQGVLSRITCQTCLESGQKSKVAKGAKRARRSSC